LSFRADDREVTARRQRTPVADAPARGHTATVRRDDGWNRRIVVWAVPGWNDDEGAADGAVVRDVGDRQDADPRRAGGTRAAGHGHRAIVASTMSSGNKESLFIAPELYVSCVTQQAVRVLSTVGRA
jgi:hypothetical protein